MTDSLVSIDLLKTFQTFVIVNYNFFFGFISLSHLYFQFGILHIEARFCLCWVMFLGPLMQVNA